jgi:hypothetical protein
LNSGVANSSGVLGHYLHDQFYITTTVQAIVPEARGANAARGLIGGGGLNSALPQSQDEGEGLHSRLCARLVDRRQSGRQIYPALRRSAGQGDRELPRRRIHGHDDG